MLFHPIIIINNFFSKFCGLCIKFLFILFAQFAKGFLLVHQILSSVSVNNFRSAIIFFQYTRQELLPSNVAISMSAYLANSFHMRSYYEISLLVLCYYMRSSFVLLYRERCRSTEFYRLFLFVNRVYMCKQ